MKKLPPIIKYIPFVNFATCPYYLFSSFRFKHNRMVFFLLTMILGASGSILLSFGHSFHNDITNILAEVYSYYIVPLIINYLGEKLVL